MSKYEQVNDTECLKLWQSLNGEFSKIIDNDPTPAKVKDKLSELKTRVQSKNTLTGRQTESLSARIDNYMAGTYGKNNNEAKKG